jgi:hypothetical protein
LLCGCEIFSGNPDGDMGEGREVTKWTRVQFFGDAGFDASLFQPAPYKTCFGGIAKGCDNLEGLVSFDWGRLWSGCPKFGIAVGTPFGIVRILESTFRARSHDELL